MIAPKEYVVATAKLLAKSTMRCPDQWFTKGAVAARRVDSFPVHICEDFVTRRLRFALPFALRCRVGNGPERLGGPVKRIRKLLDP